MHNDIWVLLSFFSPLAERYSRCMTHDGMHHDIWVLLLSFFNPLAERYSQASGPVCPRQACGLRCMTHDGMHHDIWVLLSFFYGTQTLSGLASVIGRALLG